jgi:hypothetical protein
MYTRRDFLKTTATAAIVAPLIVKSSTILIYMQVEPQRPQGIEKLELCETFGAPRGVRIYKI